jgi:hypothetical protein
VSEWSLERNFIRRAEFWVWMERTPSPPTVLWDTDVIPGNFAVPTVASFFTSPQEGMPTLVDSLDNPSGEETSGHGMSKHGSENRIHKD